MIKVVANTAVLNATHVQQTYRYVRVVNTHATSVANVEIGTAEATVQKTINLDGGESVTLDLGDQGLWLSLNTNVVTCYVTPIAGGSA
jgi:hypothetical protein